MEEHAKSWLDAERDMMETPYGVIRDRQMELLEREDGMMERDGVKELRAGLVEEAGEVLGEQR